LETIEYLAEIRHDGRLHKFTILNLELLVCQSCGEKVFTEKVDTQENDALGDKSQDPGLGLSDVAGGSHMPVS
jgi:hypothetical protein